jgi:hypothetical protein
MKSKILKQLNYMHIIICACISIFMPLVALGETIDDLKAKAQAGDAKAQLKLGTHYLNGTNIEQRPEGIRLIRQSAEQGNLEAQKGLAFLLRTLYRTGMYVST